MGLVATCSHCAEAKPLASFHKDKNRKNGRYPTCTPCKNTYYLKNRDTVLAHQRIYNATHKREISELGKRYAARRFFYIRASNLKLKHPDQPTASFAELATLWKSQQGKCAVTDRRLDRSNCQLDHIVPVARSGSGKIENLRWVHRDVNYAKRDLSEQDFFKLCSDVIIANLRKQEIQIA